MDTAAHQPSPLPSMPRLRSLDVLRGIAILGTLGTNIFLFIDTGLSSPGPQAIDAILNQLTNGKFLALLTLMFGIALTIQFDSAARRQQKWPLVYLWRGVLLFLDGLLHYILVFAYDVLMTYALVGLVVSYVQLTTPRVQKAVFSVAALLHLGLLILPMMGISIPGLGIYGQAANMESETEAVSDEVVRFHDDFSDTWYVFEGESLINETTGEEVGIDESLGEAEMKDSYLTDVKYRLDFFREGRSEALYILPMSLALFLGGSFLYRSGLFEPRGHRLRLTLMVIGGIALAWDLLGAVAPRYVVPGDASRYGLPILVALGIAAATSAFYQSRRIGAMGERMEDVGRMALSCYVGQNLVCMLLFSSWALNVDRFIPDEWGVWKVATGYVIVAALIVFFSWAWRQRFERGPLEWIWATSYNALMQITPGWRRPRAATA